MMRVTIRTRYKNHPGSNVGAYVATGAGRSAKVRTDQALSSAENHRRAADTLAARLDLVIVGDGDYAHPGTSVMIWQTEPAQH